MAALNSGMDYLAQPSGIIKFGILVMVGNLSWLFLYPYVFYVTLPFYRRLGVYSVYEYLERRFDLSVRILTATIFLLWRLGWMATALYVPCLALSAATGNDQLLKPMIIVLGLLVTAYTMMGGIKAVIWIDVAQFCVMFTGLTLTFIVVVWNIPGGLPATFNNVTEVGLVEMPAAHEEGFLASAWNYFFIPMTFFGILISSLVSRVTTYTSDQVMIQRFQASQTIQDARRGFLITAITDAIWMTTLSFIGIALFTYYSQVGELPAGFRENTDKIFPAFMSEVFPVGVTGLVIAAIIAASLSSIDSALNSMTAVCMLDFVDRLYLKWTTPNVRKTSEMNRTQVRISRAITIILGIIGITLACNVDRLGTILEIGNKLIVSFTGPILGIFLLGMFIRRATRHAVFCAGILGTIVAIYCIFWSSAQLVADLANHVPLILRLFPAGPPLSFQWPPLAGFLTTFVLGFSLSFLEQPDSKASRWTWSSVIQTELQE